MSELAGLIQKLKDMTASLRQSVTGPPVHEINFSRALDDQRDQVLTIEQRGGDAAAMKYAENVNALGAKMRGRGQDCRATLTAKTRDAAQDWADAANEHGRRLRGRS